MSESLSVRALGSAPRLWAEFLVIFAALPLVMAFAMTPDIMWTALSGVTIASLVLLLFTPGFRWRSLIRGRLIADWRITLLFVLITAIIAVALVHWLVPGRFLSLPRYATELWLTIMALYPFLSALPQEIVYRVLFFERYGHLFPNTQVAIAVNALCFGLAHLFFMNWPALILTTIGGLIFAWAYAEKRSFGFACLLHAIGGQIIFTSGLGIYFYHGAV